MELVKNSPWAVRLCKSRRSAPQILLDRDETKIGKKPGKMTSGAPDPSFHHKSLEKGQAIDCSWGSHFPRVKIEKCRDSMLIETTDKPSNQPVGQATKPPTATCRVVSPGASQHQGGQLPQQPGSTTESVGLPWVGLITDESKRRPAGIILETLFRKHFRGPRIEIVDGPLGRAKSDGSDPGYGSETFYPATQDVTELSRGQPVHQFVIPAVIADFMALTMDAGYEFRMLFCHITQNKEGGADLEHLEELQKLLGIHHHRRW